MGQAEKDRAYRAQQRQLRMSRSRAVLMQSASIDSTARQPEAARWYCLYVHPGREFAVESVLRDANVEFCLPREKWVAERRGRKIEGEKAMFPGYLPVRFVWSASAFQAFKRVRGVFDFVGGVDGYYSIPDKHIQRLRLWETGGDPTRVETDKTMAEGDKAEIIFGPFAGLRCIVLAVKWSRQARARVLVRDKGVELEIQSIPLAFLEKL